MKGVAQQIPDPRVEDLVRAGRVRVALLGGVAPGIGMDLARAFAARLGIEVLPIEYPTPAAVLESLKTGASDVGFLVIDPARAAVVDFSPPFLERAFTYLVPSGSKIRSVADADQPGVRIAVVSNLAILWPECGTRSSSLPRRLGPTGHCQPAAGPQCETPSNGTCGTSPPG